MSEFMESHSVSKLLGAPPGYVGYGRDSVLSSKLSGEKYYVVLFDEIEKADKNISDLMLQILDYGRLTLANGSFVDFGLSDCSRVFDKFIYDFCMSSRKDFVLNSYNKLYGSRPLKRNSEVFFDFISGVEDIFKSGGVVDFFI
ncbi:conserved hypothetical protein (apicoplast) [Theileria equi strain WA]|uniref:ATPase AAA-type core domain-containing protein n=1 Tax=Theileria equi strain WA TaxID=1537102 RepID=L1L9W2_THEEQ|nr:conserved hypothetical protein [Theileria equi strain WA]EKX71965.1 conserved hypothetical protein [Theileria equi strain WA]|eukprot:XP_025033558.1 conserved hypothetical protein (apicoplast) [Theileria equi strain WA]